MWVKKPDMSTMTKSQLEDVIKKWHPKINGARIIAFALTLLSLGLGVKSCRNDKEIGEKNAKIENLKGANEDLQSQLGGIGSQLQDIEEYAKQASEACGLREQNEILIDSIAKLNEDKKILNNEILELRKKLKKYQQSKKKITVQKDTVYVQQPKVAEPKDTFNVDVKIKRTYYWTYGR